MFRRWLSNGLVRVLRQPAGRPDSTYVCKVCTLQNQLKCVLPTMIAIRCWSSLKMHSSRNRPIWSLPLILPAGIMSFLFPKDPNDEDDTPEGKLIMCIKRSILCIQREQYAKAEQMLHVALRMAQDLQNKEGITFIFDVMANLAMETEQYKKAEKLFVTVMQRLLADGCAQDDIKV